LRAPVSCGLGSEACGSATRLAGTRFLGTFAPDRTAADPSGTGESRPGAMALLLGVIAFRSLAWFGLITFVPLWEVSLGHSKSHGSHLLSLMLLAGGLGTLAAGPIADRLGRRPVLIASMLFVGPLTLVYVVVGWIGALALMLLAAWLAVATVLRERSS